MGDRERKEGGDVVVDRKTGKEGGEVKWSKACFAKLAKLV